MNDAFEHIKQNFSLKKQAKKLDKMAKVHFHIDLIDCTIVECHSQEKPKQRLPHFSLLLPWAVELPHDAFRFFFRMPFPLQSKQSVLSLIVKSNWSSLKDIQGLFGNKYAF